MTLKVLIVDDESAGRSALVEMCGRHEDVEIVGEVETGHYPPVPHRPRFLVGERQHRLYPLEVEKIDYIRSNGNYVTIRSGRSDFISRDSIKRLGAHLADLGFVRIERSLLLNVRAVAYAEAAGRGTFSFTLSCGACLQSGTAYRNSILDVLPLAPRRRGQSTP